MVGNLSRPSKVTTRRTADGHSLELNKAEHHVGVLVGAPTVRSLRVSPTALVCLNETPATVLAALDGDLESATASGRNQVVAGLIGTILNSNIAACLCEHTRSERLRSDGNLV